MDEDTEKINNRLPNRFRIVDKIASYLTWPERDIRFRSLRVILNRSTDSVVKRNGKILLEASTNYMEEAKKAIREISQRMNPEIPVVNVVEDEDIYDFFDPDIPRKTPSTSKQLIKTIDEEMEAYEALQDADFKSCKLYFFRNFIIY